MLRLLWFLLLLQTEQLRQWLAANSNSIPPGAKEAASMAASLEDNDLASAILKMLGFGSEKQITPLEATLQPPMAPITPRIGVKVSERDVCPFGADPLTLSGEYAYCKPSLIGECPVGFLCDQSFVLGRSICCQDLRNRPSVSTDRLPNPPQSSSRPVMERSTISAATDTTQQPRWTPLGIISTRRAPWYIKDRTPWEPTYNRVTDETTTLTVASTTSSTTAAAPTTTTSTVVSTTMTKEAGTMPSTSILSTTTTRTGDAMRVMSPRPLNPWARIWTTKSASRNMVNVTVLQSGSVRSLNGAELESVGAISLINDNGRLLLVDTGAASDTERLLQSLAKESVTLDEIETVVITHGHPGHMGNMNFFGKKPILFHSMEYIGRHVTHTELKDRPYRRLSNNVEVWKTPGQTQHDLSVLVHNVPEYGSMAVVGDLIPSEAFLAEKIDLMLDEGVWDSAIKRQNANLIICMADWVIPGHGQPFRVLPRYRQKAGCTHLLAQQRLLSVQ